MKQNNLATDKTLLPVSILKPLQGIILSLISQLLSCYCFTRWSTLNFFQSQFEYHLLLEVSEKVILGLKGGWNSL